jgi:hypothetical protein
LTLLWPCLGWAQTTVPFSDDFEGVTIVPPWYFLWTVPTVTLNTNLAYVHSGSKSLQIYYNIVNPGFLDQNHHVQQKFTPKLDHVFARGYVYFKSPEPGAEINLVQRKLMYFFSDPSPADWSIVLNTWWHSPLDGKLWLAINSSRTGRTQVINWDIATLEWDTWYCLEVEVQANTPGLSDGILRVWVDGVNVYQSTTRELRGDFTDGLEEFQFGDQVSRNGTFVVEEYRYWDDVVIDDEYIGVIPDNPVDPSALLGSAGEVFDAQKVGTTSAARLVMLQSTGAGPLTIASIGVSGDFARTHDCPISPATLASGLYCTISLTVTPTVGGALAGTLTVTDDAPDSPQTAALSGTGLVPVTVSGGATLSGGTIR